MRNKEKDTINIVIGKHMAELRAKFNLSQKDSDRIIMVGDRRNDIEGSHKNGIQTVSVLYGYGSIKEFKDSGADFIVETVETLEKFLLSI